MKDKIQIGSGENKRDGYLNIDIRAWTNPDLVWDCNDVPYPIYGDSAKHILAEHVLEHLDDWEVQLREWRRIIRNDGVIEFAVPHNSCFYLNPYHKFPIGTKGLIDYYNKYNPTERLKVVKRKYVWFRQIGVFSRPVDMVMNLLPAWFVDRFMSKLVFGLEEIRFWCKKVDI